MEKLSQAPLECGFLDLIDIELMQDFTDNLFQLTEISSAILDTKGVVLAASGWREICTRFHRKNIDTNKNCIQSDTILSSKKSRKGDYSIYKCKNGLIDICIPIVIESIHYGNIYIGQFLFEEPDIDFFTTRAIKYGFDIEDYLGCLAKVPIFQQEKIENAIKLLKSLSRIIVNQGVDKKRLISYNKELNNIVEKKTDELVYSNTLLRLLSNTSFDGIVLSENGIIIEVNSILVDFIECNDPSEMIGKKLIDFVADRYKEDVWEKALSGYDKLYQSTVLTRNGREIPVYLKGKNFHYKGRTIRGTIVRDLSEKVQAEKEIKMLRTILPLCSFCKKVRNDQGYWEQVDVYMHNHSMADISHGVCPECAEKHYGAILKKLKTGKNEND